MCLKHKLKQLNNVIGLMLCSCILDRLCTCVMAMIFYHFRNTSVLSHNSVLIIQAGVLASLLVRVYIRTCVHYDY